MKAEFSVNVEGYKELQELLAENGVILENLYENLKAIENIRLKINGQINQPSAGTDDQ